MGKARDEIRRLVEHEAAREQIESQNIGAQLAAGSGSFAAEMEQTRSCTSCGALMGQFQVNCSECARTEPEVFTCESCGAALEQYQHSCSCGTFSNESFRADNRPPECRFFENDAACGADAEWVVFALGDMKPMCGLHKNNMEENCVGKVEAVRWDAETEELTCDCCGQTYSSPELAQKCCAPTERTIHILECEDDGKTVCGLAALDVNWMIREAFSLHEQNTNFDPNPYCHTCMGENHG